MIQVQNITRRFGGTVALNDVSFEIEKGDVIGILGPNGSGKTTLINILLGILRPNTGQILFDNKNIWPHRSELLPQIGAVIEIPRLYPRLSGYDNLRIFSAFLEVPNKEQRINEVLKLVDLDETGPVMFQNYSLGMKQRLGIALSLLNDPEILVFDEPTNGLDPEGIVKVREIIQHLASLGKTVILCSHLIVEVETVCSKVVILRQGNLIRKLNREQLANRTKTFEIEVSEENLQSASEAIKAINNVSILELKNNSIVISLPENAEAQTLKQLIQAGIEVKTFTRRVESLEKIFIEALK